MAEVSFYDEDVELAAREVLKSAAEALDAGRDLLDKSSRLKVATRWHDRAKWKKVVDRIEGRLLECSRSVALGEQGEIEYRRAVAYALMIIEGAKRKD